MMLFAFSAMAQINYGKRLWTFPATSHEAVSEVPAKIFADFKEAYKVETTNQETGEVTTTYTELTNEKVGVFVTDVRVATAGDVTATFAYRSGNGSNIRMDLGGVDLVNANGEVVYSDYHFGYAGSNLVNNVYTLSSVAVGDYTMRVFIPAQKEDLTAANNDSKGTLTIAGAWMYPNEGVYYNIKNVRQNKYVTFKGEGKQFTQESVNNGAGSYWHFVEASLDDVKKWDKAWLEDGAIPEGVKPYWVYNAACEKGVENVTNGYMASPDMSETYPAKIYYIGVHTKDGNTGLIFRPCHEDGSSWNDDQANGTALGHYTSNDAGSLWSIELANVADNDLMALGTTAKNEALATVASYEQAYYFNPTAAQLNATRTAINAIDCSTRVKALMSVIDGIAAAKAAELASCTTAPKAGDRFMMKNVGRNGGKDFLCASADGNVKTVSDGNAFDCVWVLVEADGGFKLYNEKLGVYVGALSTSNNTVMNYTSDAEAAGVYEISQTGVYTLFHAKGQDGNGYMHQSNWSGKEIVRWDNGDCSQWQLLKAPFELTTDKENPILYAIKSARNNGNYYFTLEGNNVKLVNNADIVNNNNAKWFFMLDENKNVKIYPYAGEGKTMGYLTVGNGDAKLTTDNTIADWVADTYYLYLNVDKAADYNNKYFAFRPTEGNNYVSNIYGTSHLVGFYNAYNDHGTRLGFESINETVLANKVATWEPYLAHEGDKVNQYVIADGVKTALTEAIAVSAQKSSDATAINAALTALNAFELPTINQPTVGKFYRLKNHQSGWYATSTLRTGEAEHSNKLYMKNTNSAESVWYLAEGNKLVSFKEGRYLGDMSSDWSFEAVGSEGNAVVFNESAVVGRYQILPSSGRALYGDQVRVDAAGSDQKSGNYAWELEEVTWLPIPVNVEAGYTSLYSPVELNPSYGGARFKVYTVSEVSATHAILKEQDFIPANTGVVLQLTEHGKSGMEDGCVFLQVKATETEATSKLLGTYADEYITDEAYVLGIVNSEVGLYTAKKNFNDQNQKVEEGGVKWLNNGFKAYLPKTSGASLALRFNFGGETTAIESVLNNGVNANAPIYDLSGRRVNNAVKGGIYIQNGKKFIVK